MELLNSKQIDHINDILVEQGVSYTDLRNNLLDHICCMVEEQMENEENYSNSLDYALEKFGLQNLKLIQESTLHLLNLKLNKMKKFTSITGLLSATMVIAGIIFKMNHLMGAGILLVLGLSITSLIVLPSLVYITFLSKNDKQSSIATSIGYIAGMFLSLGGMFKLMHWPLAMVFFWSGVIILVLVFIPMYTALSYRLAENKLFSLSKSMLIVAAIFFFWALSSGTRIFKVDIGSKEIPKIEVQQN